MRLRVNKIYLVFYTLYILVGCSANMERVFDNPVDPESIQAQRRAAAPTDTPTPPSAAGSPTAIPAPTAEIPRFFFRKMSAPFVSNEYEIKKTNGNIADSVVVLKSKFEDSVTFLSLERSTNLSQYFWRLNARKFRLSETRFTPTSSSSSPVNLFPECNDPIQGNGVSSFRVKGIVDKYKSPGFNSESLPDNLTYVKIEADCRSSSLGYYPTTLTKTFSLSSISEANSTTTVPLASDQNIKCLVPQRRLQIDSTGKIFDYQFVQNAAINANFANPSSPLYLGSISECFEFSSKLHIKTNSYSNNCYQYDFGTGALTTAACVVGNSIRTFQPFDFLHSPFADDAYSYSSEKVLYHLKSGNSEYKITSSPGSASSSALRTISLLINNKKVPFEREIPFGNVVTQNSSGSSAIVGREQSYGARVIGWSKDKDYLFLSNEILSADAIAATRVVQLTIDSPAPNSVVNKNISLSGTCIPNATITASGNVEGENLSTICSSSGIYQISLRLSGADDSKNVVVTDTGIPGQPTSASRNLILDTTSPDVVISGPSSTLLRQATSATFTVSFSDANQISSVSQIAINLSSSDGVTCNKTISGGDNGPYTVAVSNCTGNGLVGFSVAAGAATDQVGNQSLPAKSANNITVDNQSPIILGLALSNAAADGFINSSESSLPTAVVEFSGSGSTSQSYAIVSGTTSACSQSLPYASAIPSASAIAISDGQTMKVCVKASDAAGNDSYFLSNAIVTDKTPPIISLSSPSPALIGSTQQASFTVSFWDSISGVSSATLATGNISLIGAISGCSLAMAGTSSSNRTVTISSCTASNGTISISISGAALLDTAGNSTSNSNGSVSLGVNNSQPVLTVDYPTPNAQFVGSVTLTGTCQANLSVIASSTGVLNSPRSVVCSALGTYSLPMELIGTDGAKHIDISSTSSQGVLARVSRAIIKDTTAPTVSISSANRLELMNSDSASYNVTFADSGGIGAVDVSKIRITASIGVTCNHLVSTLGVASYSVSISGCNGEGTVSVVVQPGAAADHAGNASTSTSSDSVIKVLRGWYFEAYIKASNAEQSDGFGDPVSINGDTLAVIASGEDSAQRSITNGLYTSYANDAASSSGAIYIFKRSSDQWVQEAYIKTSNADSYDGLVSVSLSHDILAVGAQGEDSSQSTITSGTIASFDNSITASGAVYIFRRTGSQWIQEAYIKPPNPGLEDFFGTTVSLSNDVLAVGAPIEDTFQRTITNGNTIVSNNDLIDSGAVYVFRRASGTWGQDGFIKASNADSYDHFGTKVTLHGDLLAASAIYEDSISRTITNGAMSDSDNSGSGSGAVYLFRSEGKKWIQVAYIKAANADPGDYFGNAIHLSGDTLAVGVEKESSNQNYITNDNFASNDNSLKLSGAVYIYRLSNNLWKQEAYLKAANVDPNDGFGFSLALSGDTLAVGVPAEDSNQRTISNGSIASNDNSAESAGAAYVYRRQSSQWIQESYIKAPNGETADNFGYSVSISGDSIAVGAHGEDSNRSEIFNGISINDNNYQHSSGAVYVFRNRSRMFDPDIRISSKTKNSITLSWHENLGLANRVKISPASSGSAIPTTCTDVNAVELAAGITTYTYSGLAEGTKYGFRVCAFDGTNVSEGALIWDNTFARPDKPTLVSETVTGLSVILSGTCDSSAASHSATSSYGSVQSVLCSPTGVLSVLIHLPPGSSAFNVTPSSTNLFGTSSGDQISFERTAFTCPPGYAGVPASRIIGLGSIQAVKNATDWRYNVDRDFCVMKDPPGSAGGINRYTANQNCANLGSGYSLMSNLHWQTISRNAESLASNWSDGNPLIGTFGGSMYALSNGEVVNYLSGGWVWVLDSYYADPSFPTNSSAIEFTDNYYFSENGGNKKLYSPANARISAGLGNIEFVQFSSNSRYLLRGGGGAFSMIAMIPDSTSIGYRNFSYRCSYSPQ